MPSSVIRRSRRHGLMKKNQMANGRPTQRTTAFAMSGIFMCNGGSGWPGGHLLEVRSGDPSGPHVQLQNQDRAAECRPDLDRLALGLHLGTEFGRSAE